jgi:hypothetical protein
MQTSCGTTNLGDLIERILDKGIVISGDIKIKLVDVELLTIQIRLVICSVEKAAEIGLDWWNRDSQFAGGSRTNRELDGLNARIRALETATGTVPSPRAKPRRGVSKGVRLDVGTATAARV